MSEAKAKTKSGAKDTLSQAPCERKKVAKTSTEKVAKTSKKHPDHIRSKDLRMSARSGDYVKTDTVGGQNYFKKNGYFYKQTTEGKKKRVSKEEYYKERKEGGHKIDLKFMAALLNKRPGKAMDKKGALFEKVRDLLNDREFSFRKKTREGNNIVDRSAERDFAKFVAFGTKFTWSVPHIAKLKQYKSQLKKQMHKWDDPSVPGLKSVYDEILKKVDRLVKNLKSDYEKRGKEVEAGLKEIKELSKKETKARAEADAHAKSEKKFQSQANTHQKRRHRIDTDASRHRQAAAAHKSKSQAERALAKQHNAEKQRATSTAQSCTRAIATSSRSGRDAKSARSSSSFSRSTQSSTRNHYQSDYSSYSTSRGDSVREWSSAPPSSSISNPWNAFQHANAGQGWTRSEMSANYHASKN